MLPAGFNPPFIAVLDTPEGEEVWVNGKQIDRTYDASGIRRKYVARNVVGTQSILIKTDNGGDQAQAEWDLWWSLDPEDKPFFTPIIAGGVSSKGHSTWVASPYLEFPGSYDGGKDLDRKEEYHFLDLPDRVRRKAEELRHKYDIGDWSSRQYKPAPSNWPVEFVIHDYGFDYSLGKRRSDPSFSMTKSDPALVVASYLATVEKRYGVKAYDVLAPTFQAQATEPVVIQTAAQRGAQLHDDLMKQAQEMIRRDLDRPIWKGKARRKAKAHDDPPGPGEPHVRRIIDQEKIKRRHFIIDDPATAVVEPLPMIEEVWDHSRQAWVRVR